jgi:hypothetical protein
MLGEGKENSAMERNGNISSRFTSQSLTKFFKQTTSIKVIGKKRFLKMITPLF